MNEWWRDPGAFGSSGPFPRAAVHRGNYAACCECETCARTTFLLVYMFEAMEPADQALRLPGDIYPARRTA